MTYAKSQMRMRISRILLMLAVLAMVAVTSIMVTVTRRLLASGGLHAEYWTLNAVGDRGFLLKTVDADVSPALVQRRMRTFKQGFSAEWDGYIVIPAARRYRFAVAADDTAALYVDGRLAASHEMPTGSRAIDLSRGLHRLRLLYSDFGGQQEIDVLWTTDDGALSRVPRILFVPDIPFSREIRLRRLAAAANPILPWGWWALLWLGVGWVVQQLWTRGVPDRSGAGGKVRVVRVLLALSALLFATGVWWGAPDQSWAPDEISPADVLFAVQSRFAGGWATKYPPLHYAALAVFYSPFQAAAAFNLIDLDSGAQSDLLIAGRLLSVAMGIGIVALTYAIARENFGVRAGVFAAAIVAVAMPLTYYSKIANLDVPYVFWLTMSLLFYLRIYRTGRPRDFYLFALAGVAAICTKDQAYGFFVLPAAVMVLRSLTYRQRSVRPASVPSRGVLVRMVALTALALAAGYNLPFNWSGFVEHVRLITGPDSEGFRAYPSTPLGVLHMSRDAFVQLGHFMSWPLFAVSVWAAMRAISGADGRFRYLLLPAVSYYVFFISVVMYHYDRFFLGIVVILALVTGWWLDRWTQPGVTVRRLRLTLVCAALAYAFARSISLDALMIQDSRYSVERSLVSIVSPGEVVGAAGQYLPRSSVIGWTLLPPDEKELESKRPTYVIVNAGFSLRGDAESTSRRFYDTISTGATRYRLLLRHRTKPMFPLSLERRFVQVAEDPFSNLTKINPLIEVYVRK
jgi:dolichyl-phosphate-mannose-protein mannosyltransferase/PA14 domain-containing protein